MAVSQKLTLALFGGACPVATVPATTATRIRSQQISFSTTQGSPLFSGPKSSVAKVQFLKAADQSSNRSRYLKTAISSFAAQHETLGAVQKANIEISNKLNVIEKTISEGWEALDEVLKKMDKLEEEDDLFVYGRPLKEHLADWTEYQQYGYGPEEEIKDEPYQDRLVRYKKDTGLLEAIQTGKGKIHGVPVAFGSMEFGFMGGSMGSVVGEKITRLIECATNEFLPLILVCASGGARMQEGSFSLMQMAKISGALYYFRQKSVQRSNHIQKLFYAAILASPTTGGVLASFGMLGDVIISEPKTFIAFAGPRVIESILKEVVPEGSHAAEPLLEKGIIDEIVDRYDLKSVLAMLLDFHYYSPLPYVFSQNPVKTLAGATLQYESGGDEVEDGPSSAAS
uniref:Acetyl-CoA carboxylase subunit beta n=1 Tax=Monsonia emarginata TaxID=28966 RepID=A0A286SC32_9ROSI|nr:acetyl-CoA carboxylase subunit beta [Monsonia emarginata]